MAVKGKIAQYSEMLKNKDISCIELTQKYIDEIQKCDDKLNSYVLELLDFLQVDLIQQKLLMKKSLRVKHWVCLKVFL